MEQIYDMIVIGGGPAGYTAALYAARSGLSVVVLEKLSAGGQMALTGQQDNVVANAPHTARELAGNWEHPYSREQAAFPLPWVGEAKFFPYVSKIDAGYGDRNLCCRNCE